MKILAFAVSSLIGFLISHYLLHGAAGAYTSLLLSYHLYLAFLVLLTNREKGLSMSLPLSIVMHLAFVGVVVSFAFLRHQIPAFTVVSLFVPALAPFESHWLFSGSGSIMPRPAAAPAAKAALPDNYEPTYEDHEAFKKYLCQKDRLFRKHGMSIDDEFRAWLTARVNQKA